MTTERSPNGAVGPASGGLPGAAQVVGPGLEEMDTRDEGEGPQQLPERSIVPMEGLSASEAAALNPVDRLMLRHLGSMYRVLEGILEEQRLTRERIVESEDAISGPLGPFVRAVTVSTSGTPVSGPDLELQPGTVVSIRQRRHAGTPTGYVAFSRQSVGNSNERMELEDGDTIRDLKKLRNLSDLWFDADTNDTAFEMVLER